MNDIDKRLQTALANSPNRVYKKTRDFEAFVEQEKQRVREAADSAVNLQLEEQVRAALGDIEHKQNQAEEKLREAAHDAQETAAYKEAAIQSLNGQRDESTAILNQQRDAAICVLDEMETLLNIATDESWGGTYDISARDDHKAANRLRIVAFVLYGLAVGVAVGFAWWTSQNPPDGWEWLMRSFIGGPVVILVWAAAYASRESREHRNSARLFKYQSLAFISLDRYATRIQEMEQTSAPASQFLIGLAQSLFTSQIDAHVDQIKTHGRTGRFAMRLLGERAGNT